MNPITIVAIIVAIMTTAAGIKNASSKEQPMNGEWTKSATSYRDCLRHHLSLLEEAKGTSRAKEVADKTEHMCDKEKARFKGIDERDRDRDTTDHEF